METLDFILNGAETKRYHTWPTLREQTVGAHSFSVAMLCALMAQDADPVDGEGLTVPLLMAALTHDLAEHKMGDIPAPAKRSLPAFKYENGNDDITFREMWGRLENGHLISVGLDWEHLLTPKQKRWLKLADAMDGALWCARERAMGNKLIGPVFQNFSDYIVQLLHKPGAEESMVHSLVQYINDMWEQADGC